MRRAVAAGICGTGECVGGEGGGRESGKSGEARAGGVQLARLLPHRPMSARGRAHQCRCGGCVCVQGCLGKRQSARARTDRTSQNAVASQRSSLLPCPLPPPLPPHPSLVLGVRARVAADPDFAFKIAVECGLDAAIILGVNAAARGLSSLVTDADLVASQVAVSLLNYCALVYLLAPRRGGASAASSRRFTRVAARVPAHVFQAGPFSPAARMGCFGVRALQYGALGAVSGVVGGGAIEALTTARAAADPSFTPPPTWAPPLATGGVWAYFMALSSNARYNLVNGAEAAVASAAPGSAKAATIALRLATNWAGASHFMHVADRLGLNRPRPRLMAAA